ncbi:uncharacterized protein [Pyrus communis]|uniref:uncharacterized protein n=1 Tax=Pyrus communis TaxID=23211 RepID=UPI0035C1C030
MAIVLSYVDKNGHVLECFISIEHVISTAAFSLKETIDEVFSRHKLSMSRLCGQGYDGASNMQDILRITNELPQALQMKDQDIVNAMKLVGVCKQRLEMMRKSGWGSLLGEVFEFHLKHDIDVPNMDAGSFSAFDSQKLLRLAQFYPKDFSMNELVILNIQLETYIVNMRSSIEFLGLKEIGDLAN